MQKEEALVEVGALMAEKDIGNLYDYFGCQPEKQGFRFTVWAPHAKNVFLLGNFSNWEMGIQMRKLSKKGIWTCVATEAVEGQPYKYLVEQADGTFKLKIDPFAFEFEVRPKDASIVKKRPKKRWADNKWMSSRKKRQSPERPMNIYEVHFSSWKRHSDGSVYSVKDMQESLLSYVKKMGYTHIEFLPLTEHPLDESWGYQSIGYFAFSSKFGTMEEFQSFVEAAHLENIGVIMDWVPGHFNLNDYGLSYFDGTAQFEYEDPIQAINKRWGTGSFDLGKKQVQNYLLSSALFWIHTFHLDGLRVDAVSSMLYLDYDEGPWVPNKEGTNVNLEGKDFLQTFTQFVRQDAPDVLLMAEESTAWKGVTARVEDGGLGFHYKWNMGWMNDTLSFFEEDPLYRSYAYRKITFPFMYAFDEQYVLPFSHDEVVHGKKSLMHKMPGNRYNQFANLRTMEVWRMTHPGKKLHFMGNEYGQFLEWKDSQGLEWDNEKDEKNKEHHYFMKYLNHFYLKNRSLWEQDHLQEGLVVLEADDQKNVTLSYIRQGKKKRDFLVIVLNLHPTQHEHYRLGVPYKGVYEEVLNTEKSEFGGVWETGQGKLTTKPIPHGSYAHSLEFILPAMSALILKPVRIYKEQVYSMSRTTIEGGKKEKATFLLNTHD